jgi:stalled ribosome rescue protein Dom34
MKEQQIRDSERIDRIFARLEEKATAFDNLDELLLGPPGFVRREFAEDLQEWPPDLYMLVEEYAQMLEEAARTGKLGR